MSMDVRALSKSNILDGLNVIHLKFFGIWEGVNTFRTTGKKSKMFTAIMWTSILSGSPYIIFQFLCFVSVKVNLQMIMFVYLNGVPGTQVMLKMFVFWFTFSGQCKLFDLIRGDFLECIPHHKKGHVKETYKSISFVCNSFCNLAFAIHIILIVSWITFPGVDAGNGRKKIMGGWYPFPYWESPWYELVYVYEAFLFSWHGLLLALFECIIVQLLIGLYAQFVAFGYHISTLTKDDIVYSECVKGKDGDSFLVAELESVMRDYDKLYSYGKLLKEVYSFLVTFLLGTGIAVSVITNLYLLLTKNDLLSTIKFVLFFFYGAVEITIICTSSTMIQTASTNIQFCLYSSEWYEANMKYKTAVRMMMFKATKPLGMVALKMYPVNLEIVISIFRFIYTTGAVLSKMNEE